MLPKHATHINIKWYNIWDDFKLQHTERTLRIINIDIPDWEHLVEYYDSNCMCQRKQIYITIKNWILSLS